MAFDKEKIGDITHSTVTTESGSRELAYTDDFKEFIAENPGVMKDLKWVNRHIKRRPFNQGACFDRGNLRVEIIRREERLRQSVNNDNRYCLQVEVTSPPPEDDPYKSTTKSFFFVKTTPGIHFQPKESGGVNEIMATQKAKDALQNLSNELPKVKIVDYQFGYQDENQTFYVSKLLKGVRLDEYLENLVENNSPDSENYDPRINHEYLRLLNRGLAIGEKLKGFFDVEDSNMIYNPETDEIFVFDIFINK